MNNSDIFFTKFSKTVFDAIAEINLEQETILVHYAKTHKELEGNIIPVNELTNLMDTYSIIDTSNLRNINIDILKKIYGENPAGKSYSFNTGIKPNIIKRYILSLHPVIGENKLYATIRPAETSKDMLTFMSRKTPLNFKLSDIIYIGYGNHCVKIYTKNGCNNMFNISFNDAAEMVLEYSNFTRSYKNCIINMDKVVKIENDSFIMSNNDIIAIPKRRLKEIKNIYQEYLVLKNNSK